MWFQQDNAPQSEPLIIILNDNGYRAAGKDVFDRLSSGHKLLALDLLLDGATRPEVPDSSDWALLLDSSGDRSLGLEVAQLLGVAQWLRSTTGAVDIRIDTDGIRSQVIALLASAIQPDAFAEVRSQNAMNSLAYLLNKPVPLRSAPELFCLDLYRYFDIDSLTALAVPAKIARSIDDSGK
jgi:hypothetical protein